MSPSRSIACVSRLSASGYSPSLCAIRPSCRYGDAAQGSIERAVSAWSTAPATFPSRNARWLALISRSTSSGPTSAIAAIQASASPATARPKRRSPRRPLGGGDLLAPGGDEGAGGEAEDRPQRRYLPEPVVADPDGEDQHRREQSRVGLPPGWAAARQAERPIQRSVPIRARTSSPPITPELGEGLQVERVGVDAPSGRSTEAAPRRTGRCPRRGRAIGSSSKASMATRQKSWRPALRSRRSAGRGRSGTRCRSWRSRPRRGCRRRPPRPRRRPRGRRPTVLSSLGFRESSTARRVEATPALQPAEQGEEGEGESDPREQDEQHREALVNGCLRVDVVGEAVVAGTAIRAGSAPALRSPASPAARAGPWRARRRRARRSPVPARRRASR